MKLTANGIGVHVQRLGRDRAPVVFLHGLGTDSLASYYFTLGPAFAAAGHDVVMYDLRGHGRSERPPSGYRLETFVDDLVALLGELAVTAPVHLVGNSFGGTIAFGFAARLPHRAASVTMIESEPATPAWAAKMGVNLGRARDQLAEEAAFEWITANHGAHTSRLARSAGRMLRSSTLADDIPASAVLTPEEIGAVTTPVLAIYGAESDLAPQAPVLEGLLPVCRTVVVPGQQHSVLVERTELTRDLVFGWVREHSLVDAG
ncbi:alpha/beta fold hydrolase [Amycolatopsis magusensis]|uniref:alpha/beta fold hydrolase n=1 Tax=Amycolatopsis magusensis TaxID=882444 RepID=UPI0024A7D2C1|nr:alpha/beta hydrolase [Amycolatopsis magusensis]MDI5976644.1 alpha/beta hydrolase [Amycolatopsis magusensis]